MGHPHPLEVIRLVILGEFMEDGKVVLPEKVTGIVTPNLTGMLVWF